MAGVISVVIINVFLIHLASSINYAPQVTIDSGKLRGLLEDVNNTNNAQVRKYLGIPFAKAERFAAPQVPPKWPDNEVRDMTKFGKVCPQVVAPLGVKSPNDFAEDCLNLNVYVPHDSNASSSLPVMIWIHGGGYIGGSNNLYDGSYISVLGKVVVVVINYRLGVFGFLTNGKDGDIKGNYGMLDQIEALKWVKRNIKAFNGNPDEVTIFGESAGGSSVSLLMLSKTAREYFKRAIPQSGDAVAPWSSGSYDSLAAGVKAFSKKIGCQEDLSKLKTCLESKSLLQIVNASILAPFPTFVPVVDGNFLKESPSVLYDKQDFEKLDVMVGTVNDEGIVFTNGIPGLGEGANVTHGVARDYFVNAVKLPGFLSMVIPPGNPALLDATVYRYTDWRNITNIYRNRRMLVDMLGDMAFVAPSVRGVNAYSKKGARTFYYHLEYRIDGPFFGLNVPSWIRAYHAADLVFVFGFPLLTETTTAAANFSREVIKMWTNFARTGNPNTPASIGASWPQYTLNEQKYMSLKPDLTVNSHLRADYIAYWNDFIPKALLSKPTGQPCTCMPCSIAAVNTSGFVVLLMSFVFAWLF